MAGNCAGFIRQRAIGRRQHSAFARREVFGRIERPAADAPASGLFAALRRADGFRRIFDELQAVLRRDGAEALRAAGGSVVRVRWWSLLFAGAVVSFGGTFLSISHSSQFTRDMTAGRGFIALAAIIFGKWRPIPAALACLLFGLVDALQIRLQSSEIFGFTVPVQFIQVFPYVVTLVVLLGWVGSARPPKAILEEDLG